ncbi:MAG: Aminopeptidase YpdF [Phycisphaerae bacterium]|nr:Aminopeptidase YpdF [Phycisphaerae bacterium]
MARKLSERPSVIVAQRIKHCRKLMKRQGISNLLITRRADQFYLTGFNGEDGAAIITQKAVHIITDGRFFEEFQRDVPWAVQHLRSNKLSDALALAAQQAQWPHLHFQADHLTVSGLHAMQSACKKIKFNPVTGLVGELRLLKDTSEITAIRRSIDVAEAAFLSLRKALQVGMTEMEIAALLEYEMKSRGATRPSFETIVAEGPNSAAPHAIPGSRRLKAGSLLLIDWGAVVNGYCSDLTRILFIDTISDRYKRLYEIVLEAQMRAIAAIAPGRRMCDIDQIARDYITENGYGKEFSHGLGHGIGLDIHEEPRVRPTITETLKPGMVVTVEPGIYVSGLGGVRIEDDILVTAKGHEVLTSVSKSLTTALIKINRHTRKG